MKTEEITFIRSLPETNESLEYLIDKEAETRTLIEATLYKTCHIFGVDVEQAREIIIQNELVLNAVLETKSKINIKINNL